MNYSKIRKMDISNGPGVRISLFVSGCTFNCKNCFNPETHDFNNGEVFDDEVINKILTLCSSSYIKGLSILGGEPLHPKNIKEVTNLAKIFKERFNDKTIWVWSGFKFEDIKDREIFKYIDVLVDGIFIQELYSPKLKWKGSSNQRVIDINKTLKSNKVVIYEGCE